MIVRVHILFLRIIFNVNLKPRKLHLYNEASFHVTLNKLETPDFVCCLLNIYCLCVL